VVASTGFAIIGLFGGFSARRSGMDGALIKVNAPYPACALLNKRKARRG
jgi:hypothetical protein